MLLKLERTLTSPYLLYVTSTLSFIIARAITSYVRKNGPVPIAPTLIKYNSIIYSLFSLFLCIGIATSIWSEISTSTLSIRTLTSSSSTSDFDQTLRYLFHASKIYEYVDIFNVIAAGGVVNKHFGIHHFTTMYLTYSRVILYPSGWKIFAVLNTLHHAFMYAYFGGAAIFSNILPWTGTLQLIAGILGEMYVIRSLREEGKNAGGMGSLWANGVALGLFSTYLVLFAGDLRARGRKGEKED